MPAFDLQPPYPNPFNPSTTMYTIPRSTEVSLKIYDPLGREVASLVNETKSPGNYCVKFDGSSLSSGTYFATLMAGGEVEIQKISLIK